MVAGVGWLVTPQQPFISLPNLGKTPPLLATNILDWALLPFAIGIGLGVYLAAVKMQLAYAWIAGVIGFLFCVVLWYLFGWTRHSSQKKKASEEKDRRDELKQQQEGGTEMKEKIKKVLIRPRKRCLPSAATQSLQILMGMMM